MEESHSLKYCGKCNLVYIDKEQTCKDCKCGLVNFYAPSWC